MYRVTKQIIFDTFDKINKRVIFEPDVELDYKRLWMNGKPYLQISCDDICTDSFIEGPDFDIEEYVELINELTLFEVNNFIEEHKEFQHKEKPYVVNIMRTTSMAETNRFLDTIPGENVIKIEPLENNCYFIVYKMEKENNNV